MEGTIAEIRLFAGNFAPRNWALCDGQMLPISSNTSLYSVLGTMYGGDGINNFNLPKLKPPADAPPNSLRYIICLVGVYPQRN